jgi:Ca2+-transporting ATPase
MEIEGKDHDDIKSKFPHVNELVFLGLAGMIDPPRSEVKESIRLCKKAGIEVFMATGDHQLTATAIAEELGIAVKGEVAISGPELQEMSQEDLRNAVKNTHVFARVTPEHKHRVVTALQSNGRIVAVTGDGINDAPALKAAEVGVAMGITGTDVTKETAEVVLLDDNFASIVAAIEEGRVVFENIRKVVKYLVSTNMGEIFTILSVFLLFPLILPAISGQPINPEELMIFTAIQILWVNLVTDGPLDITIAVEPKETNVMEDSPRDPDTNIIDKFILQNIALVALCMAVGIIFVYLVYLNDPQFGVQKSKTVAFICLIFFQIFNSLNCRSRTQSVFKLGFFKNKAIIIAIIFSVIMTYLATVVPFLQSILYTVPLRPVDWLVVTLVSSSVWAIDELRKWMQFGRKESKK